MSTQRSLSALLRGIAADQQLVDLAITGMALDSRQVKAGDLFFAYPGVHGDGREYLTQAINNGAAAVVCEEQNWQEFSAIISEFTTVPVITIHGLAQYISEIAARFYDRPSEKMTLIGVTGTSGKTSITHFIAQSLNLLGTRAAVMGTVGIGVPPQLRLSTHTTLDAIAVQRTLAELLVDGVQVVAMEVSSHGLEQYRVQAVSFALAVYTQLAHEHLDYHHTMENYARAKAKLFEFPSLQAAIINADDEWGCEFIRSYATKLPVYAYTQENHPVENVANIVASAVTVRNDGCRVEVNSPWGDGEFNTTLLGRFNISNLLAVIGVLANLNFEWSQVLGVMAQLVGVQGRMQIMGGNGLPEVVIDYAHKPGALENVLMALKERSLGQVWCVFGCGGDRDRAKRPLMAAIAERYSDHVIVTDDNPRTESSAAIVAEICSGFSAASKAVIIANRAQAIKYAIQQAQPSDIILIAGKGHENYQIMGDQTVHFSDQEQAQAVLDQRKNNLL